MLTYIVLNLIFLLGVVAFLLTLRVTVKRTPVLKTFLLLLLLTAVFDSLIIWADIVAYDVTKISGLKLGYAPVEDFAYTIAAVLLVPYLFKRLDRHE